MEMLHTLHSDITDIPTTPSRHILVQFAGLKHQYFVNGGSRYMEPHFIWQASIDSAAPESSDVERMPKQNVRGIRTTLTKIDIMIYLLFDS
jgi:hypothetical protein